MTTPARRVVRVLHQRYGCDSGCCGHIIEVDGVTTGSFNFGHPNDDDDEAAVQFARKFVEDELGAEHVADLDWESCEVSTF